MKRLEVLFVVAMTVVGGVAASRGNPQEATRVAEVAAGGAAAAGRSYAVDGSELAYQPMACSPILNCSPLTCGALCGGPNAGVCAAPTCCICL